MRVKVVDPKQHVRMNIPIPLSLIFNRLTCPLIAHFATKYTEGLILEGDQLYRIIQSLKQSRKINGHYDLVDIETSEGEKIKISL